MADRFVVVGLARSRSRWFGELARWANAAIAPIDFVKCLTTEEARAVLGAGRPVSALLVDTDLARFDRDLISEADHAGIPTVLVGAAERRDWEAIGCAARLDADFGRDDLVEVLERCARRVTHDASPRSSRVELADDTARGHLVGVLGAGGSGTSTIAMSLAQAWAATGTHAGNDTVLVDGCRRADLAVYHDVGDVIPGLPELVEMHRGDDADPQEIRAIEFDTDRGYRLLLGLRRPRDWAGLRSRAVNAAVDGLRRTHAAVIVDLEADLETEAETGSADIEDRHAMALCTARTADAVVIVTSADMLGVHDAARICHELERCGTPAERIVVVFNRAPRSAVARTRLARTLRTLTTNAPGAVVDVRHARGTDAAHLDVAPLPPAAGTTVLTAVTEVLNGGAAGAADAASPVRIRPGELSAELLVDAVAADHPRQPSTEGRP